MNQIYPVTIFTDKEEAFVSMKEVVMLANDVLKKNTDARLACVTTMNEHYFHADGQVGWQPGPFPVHIRARLSQTNNSKDTHTTTYVDSSGAMVLTDVYVSPNDLDYVVYFLLHYFGHAHGAAIGEYYSSANIGTFRSYRDDGTWNPHDPYWGDVDQEWRAEFEFDPMMRQVPIRQMRYSSLTAAIINGGYRVCSNEPPEANSPCIKLGSHVNRCYDLEPNHQWRQWRWYTKWDLQYQRIIHGWDKAVFRDVIVTANKPLLKARKVDATKADWLIETPCACDLVKIVGKQKTVMQHYAEPGHYVYRIKNAGLLEASEWRVE